MAIDGLIATLAAFFVVTISPGPANIALSTISAAHGRMRGVTFGLGLALGLAFWGLVAATGLGAVLQTATGVLIALKIVGGFYLLWLAYQSARSACQPSGAVKPVSDKGRWFLRGLVLNISNPKAVVAWMAALSVGLGAGDTTLSLIVTTALCMALGVVNYLGYALLFSASGAMRGYAKARRWIEASVAVLFAGAGVGLLRSVVARS